jgi:hypothetical protein
MKIKIQNMDIWECRDAIYCKRSDGNLIKIQSKANHKIIEVLKHLRSVASLEDFQSEFVSRTEFSEIVKFLLSNNLIYKECEQKKQLKKIGFYGNKDVFKHLGSDLKTEQFELSFNPVYKNNSVQGLHLILTISPVFDHYSLLQDLSYRSYKSMIPVSQGLAQSLTSLRICASRVSQLMVLMLTGSSRILIKVEGKCLRRQTISPPQPASKKSR